MNSLMRRRTPHGGAMLWTVSRLQRADVYRSHLERRMKYSCNVCSYVYDPQRGDPDHGVPPGTSFDDLPEDWICPDCSVGKSEFSPQA